MGSSVETATLRVWRNGCRKGGGTSARSGISRAPPKPWTTERSVGSLLTVFPRHEGRAAYRRADLVPCFCENKDVCGKSRLRFVAVTVREDRPSLLHRPVWQLLFVGFLFVIALGLRLLYVDQPPLDFHPVRQYHSALVARGYYFEALKTAPEWKRELASLNKQEEGIVEPPIMEILTAYFAYSILGGEHLWVPRLLSALFWLVGGAFLYLTAKKIASPGAAAFSTAFYLLLPYGVWASRSFQPDPLMVMMLLVSVYTILRNHERPSPRRLLAAGLASSLTIFIKPGACFFQIFGAFVSLAIYREGFRRSLASVQLPVFTTLSILPAGLYYLYAHTFSASYIQAQADYSVRPDLLLQAFFWRGWSSQITGVMGGTLLIEKIEKLTEGVGDSSTVVGALLRLGWLAQLSDVVGGALLIGALLGILMFREGLPRALLAGMWGGYIVFGLVFTYHIHTHDYYQLQLIPVVALSLGPAGALLTSRLNQMSRQWRRRSAVLRILAVASIIVVLTAVVAGVRLIQRSDPIRAYTENRVKTYEEIGEVVDHSPRTLFLTTDYGESLKYHGWLSGKNWPNSEAILFEKQFEGIEIGAEERFSFMTSEHSPEYFIVANMGDFEEQEDTKDLLTRRFPIIAQDEDYIVFDIREKDRSE